MARWLPVGILRSGRVATWVSFDWSSALAGYAYTTDTLQYDWQDAQVQDASGAPLQNLFHMCDESQVWTERTVDLSAYAGQSVRIYFNAHGDGYIDPTTLWVDDVSLTAQ